jgi:acyl-CoA synthetase (AMP-forming)/AMP-acid ligase II
MQRHSTISAAIDVGQDNDPAIGSPGIADISYAGLREQTRQAAAMLNRLGLRRNSRIAIVLPNGPEMATCFLSVVATATAAPLNPAYRAQEFEFYLKDINADAVVVSKDTDSPVSVAARDLHIPVIPLVSRQDLGAGRFEFFGHDFDGTLDYEAAAADDVALILHTSGTTSRPKLVPLTQRNITASAANIKETLALRTADRALNIMPLFHIHGLIAGLLAPLSAGGFVSCTTGFNALKFFSWMEQVRPTWYTAVPTMHQAIIMRAASNRNIIERNKFRFIRSSSASMPTKVIDELETIFQSPLIEAYGMTEASHQMRSNPLPPGIRKRGTVGLPAGPDLAIIGEDGRILGPHEVGEIVVRGPNVTLGYENNEKANAEAFCNGWFRTGDQGSLDDEGYLTISGRLKEIIVRGGEKISPREVDEVLMKHPAVLQVVTFAMPHKTLGEDVAAAIVLREGQSATPREIHDFALQFLADFKVPREVVFVPEIPKGPTGKPQRIGLARTLGMA